MINRLVFFVVVLAGASTASMASACPYCDSSIGQQVRAGIFNSDFGYNLAVTLVPFPVLLGIVALIYFGLPPWRVRHRPEQTVEAIKADSSPHLH